MIVKRKTGKKKINAVKTSIDGIEFDSRTESYFYQRCKDLKIKCEVKPTTYTIVPPFKFNGESIRPIKYTPDFYLPDYDVVIEIKGWGNELYPMRLKLWKKYVVDNNLSLKHKQLKDKKEIDSYLLSLLP